MSDEFERIKSRFVEKWLPRVSKVFEEAVAKNPQLEKHFNGASATECAQELLTVLSEDLIYFKHDVDMKNVEYVRVDITFDETGAEVNMEFKAPEPRIIH